MINEIIEYINSRGNYKTPPTIIENALWFLVASNIGVLRPKIRIDNKVVALNYYSITIAGSGLGKNFAIEQINKLLNINYDFSRELILESFLEKNPMPIQIGNNTLEQYIPQDLLVNIEGTSQGLYMVAQALSESLYGSLNVMNEELLDIISDSNINRLKALYDGDFNASVTKGDINKNIKGIHTNMLLFGSPISLKKDKKVYEYFNNTLSSGIYRRSFIYYEEPQPLKLTDKSKFVSKPNMENIIKFMKRYKKNDTPLELSDDAKDFCNVIKNELLTFANNNLTDSRYSAELGSYSKIITLAGLHSILIGTKDIEIDSMLYAYNFYTKCRDTVQYLFNTVPPHVRYYEIIKRSKKITKSEIFEKDIFDIKSWHEDIYMLKELAYRNNEVLIEIGSSVKKYSIEPLPPTNINKIIVSVPTDGKDRKEKTVDYDSLEIPFFGEGRTIESLVQSKIVSNFLFCHLVDGKRKKNNYIETVNSLAIDVDGGFSLEDMLQLLKTLNYTYLLYTTKSHRKKKNGDIEDRYRVVIPFKHNINIDEELFPKFYENAMDAFNIQVFDTQTKNIGRLWFSSHGSELYKNNGELFDAIPYLPDTDVNEITSNQLSNLEPPSGVDEIERRVYGISKWFLSNTYPNANRNENLFKCGMFLLDVGGDIEKLHELNSMLSDPVNEREVNKVIKSCATRKSTWEERRKNSQAVVGENFIKKTYIR